ncbi:hypothetical protein ACFQVC_33035 [Streptomyces monticola]|uniref:Secreted protein n=1 Tax=Streptomyces monticola TaxID=2666263 RepID=A0ABW2JUB4_9ACTN
MPAPAVALLVVAFQGAQQLLLRAGHGLDLGELGGLFEVHASGRRPAKGGVVELLRGLGLLDGIAADTERLGGAATLNIVHVGQGQFLRLEGVPRAHLFAVRVLDQGKEPGPSVAADQVIPDMRLDPAHWAVVVFGGGVGDLLRLCAPPALEGAVGAVGPGSDADGFLDADLLD